MNELNYLVYGDYGLMAGFVSLYTAAFFMEKYCDDSCLHMYLVDASTGEVINTWIDGAWENGDY